MGKIEMKRKIIKQGHNTLTITLPIKWVNSFNLHPGDEINIAERDNGLFVSTEKMDNKSHTEIDISGLDIPSIWKYFMAVYREGYDEIKVSFNPEDKFDNPYKFITHHSYDKSYTNQKETVSAVELIRLITGRFIGFEVIEHKSNYCIIKDMTDISSREFDNSLRRVFLIIQQMGVELLEAVDTNSVKILEHTHDTDINLDKFHDYCIRVLNKTAFKDMKKTSLLFSVLYILELIGDEFKNISNHLIKDFQVKEFKNLKQLTKLVIEQLDRFYEFYSKFSREKLKELSESDTELYFFLPKLYKKSSKTSLKSDELEIFHHLRKIVEYVNALTELRVEMEF
ncbi:MAG: AbrB/MazE/SpoVT family DNA-binding domain-containing protein [Candidatus Nanoarchaeia archaeon]